LFHPKENDVDSSLNSFCFSNEPQIKLLSDIGHSQSHGLKGAPGGLERHEGRSLDRSSISRHLGHTCGRDFITIHCLACGHQRLIRAGSRDRTCPVCQKSIYEKIFQRYKEILKNRANLKFLTLTAKPVRKQSVEYVRFLASCLNRFLHRKPYDRLIKGLLATVECKKTSYGWFYYHIHCLIDGGFLNQAQISRDWRQISGFPIVHITRIRRTRNRALRYVLKYVLKGMNFDDSKDRADFRASFKGVRLIRSYGDFYALEYRSSPHVYFPCPRCGAVKSWVVLDFCNVVDLFADQPYWGEGGYSGG